VNIRFSEAIPRGGQKQSNNSHDVGTMFESFRTSGRKPPRPRPAYKRVGRLSGLDVWQRHLPLEPDKIVRDQRSISCNAQTLRWSSNGFGSDAWFLGEQRPI